MKKTNKTKFLKGDKKMMKKDHTTTLVLKYKTDSGKKTRRLHANLKEMRLKTGMTTSEVINYLNQKANQYEQENERQLKIAKKNIHVRLVGNNKYYYANQCKKFTDHVMDHGYPPRNIDKEEIVKQGISFHQYSINLGSSRFGTELKTFSSKAEMLGFVIGFNQATEI